MIRQKVIVRRLMKDHVLYWLRRFSKASGGSAGLFSLRDVRHAGETKIADAAAPSAGGWCHVTEHVKTGRASLRRQSEGNLCVGLDCVCVVIKRQANEGWSGWAAE